jgi:hypothetical protein
MEEMFIKFRKSSGNKKKDDNEINVNGKYVSLRDRPESALIINFKAPEEEIMKIHDFFDGSTELEPVFMDLDNTGDVGYYYRGMTSPEEEDDKHRLSITLQLRRGTD